MAAQSPVVALVGSGQPGPEPGVEVAEATERATKQGRGLQVTVGALDKAVGLRILRYIEDTLRGG